MSFKVVRDGAGNVIAYGPNDDNYEPSQAYAVEDIEPDLPVQPSAPTDPVQKLSNFLAANPDVAALLA